MTVTATQAPKEANAEASNQKRFAQKIQALDWKSLSDRDVNLYARLLPGQAIIEAGDRFDAETMEFCMNACPWLMLEHCLDQMDDEQVDRCAFYNYGGTIKRAAPRLSDERLEFCARAWPAEALEYAVDRLSDEMFDHCVKVQPFVALMHASHRLTPDQAMKALHKSPMWAAKFLKESHLWNAKYGKGPLTQLVCDRFVGPQIRMDWHHAAHLMSEEQLMASAILDPETALKFATGYLDDMTFDICARKCPQIAIIVAYDRVQARLEAGALQGAFDEVEAPDVKFEEL